jgi:hypothetical protein
MDSSGDTEAEVMTWMDSEAEELVSVDDECVLDLLLNRFSASSWSTKTKEEGVGS